MTDCCNQLKWEYTICFEEDMSHVGDCLRRLMKTHANLCFYILNHVHEWFGKWVVLRSSCFSGLKREEPMICLYSLSNDKDYKNHTSLNMTGEAWSLGKWIKINVMIDSRCTSNDIIDLEYTKTQHLHIQELEYIMPTRGFNGKVSWIKHHVILRLWFDKHLE